LSSSHAGGSSKAIHFGPSLEQASISAAENVLGDLDALLNPSKYFSELDELERRASEACRLASILPSPLQGLVIVSEPHSSLPSHGKSHSLFGRKLWAFSPPNDIGPF
jgi:hypothetical protein